VANSLPVAFYHRHAAALAPRYDSVSFDKVHALALPFLPPPPAAVLDIGAGSGRDAAALVALGYEVTAAEPAVALRRLGELQVSEARWLLDKLPRLPLLTRQGNRFAFILCSAVLMSLKARELVPAFASMARLLAPSGKLAVTLRDPSEGDTTGILTAHDDKTVRSAARSARLVLSTFAERPDALGRGHLWRSYVFECDKA